jgi:hypothetical protein
MKTLGGLNLDTPLDDADVGLLFPPGNFIDCRLII